MNKLTLPLALAVALAAPTAIAQCTIGHPGTLQTAIFDTWSSQLPLGFTFTFQGTAYTHFRWSDHGLVQLNNNGASGTCVGS